MISDPDGVMSTIACYDAGLSTQDGGIEMGENSDDGQDAADVLAGVRAAAAVRSDRVSPDGAHALTSHLPAHRPAYHATVFQRSAGQGAVRFGEIEGARWLSQGTQSFYGEVIRGATISIGAAPGYLTAVHVNASMVTSDRSTDALVRIQPASTWDGLQRLSATGGDSLRIDGIGLSSSAAIAGPAFQPNGTMTVLGCLIQPTHRWINASSELGERLDEQPGCTQTQRSLWLASGTPDSIVGVFGV